MFKSRNLPILKLTFGVLFVFLAACVNEQHEVLTPGESDSFKPPRQATAPSNLMMGSIQLQPDHDNSHIEALVDTYAAVTVPEWDVIHLPAVKIELVQDGDDVIPVQRGTQPSPHLYWEWIFEPGKAWDDPDKPGWTRISLPFSLQERNQNCTHYGLMRFSFRADGTITPATYQVGSETCMYFKANLWGKLTARYEPREVQDATKIISSHRKLVDSRLPVKPMSALAQDYPGTNAGAFIPPGPEDTTVYGFVINGVHYRGGCETRFGPNPYCEWLDLPSYSTAKSVFAGLVFIYLEKTWPGFAGLEVVDLVPECRLPDGRWEGVTMRHLLNMSTGNYDSTGYEVDEGAGNVEDFFLPESHAEKIRFSCTAYKRKSPPGEIFVYHTFDTYLLGTAMNAFIRQQNGMDADIFTDVLSKELFGPLVLSPVAHTSRRTSDDLAQPFTGYGLVWNPDDIARIGYWLGQEVDDHDSSLYSEEFLNAMFRDREKVQLWAAARGEAYSNGFWGFNVAPWISCDQETWIPFMAGFGGNIVALIPNGSVYYYFSDGNQFKWAAAAAESHLISNYCDTK